MRVIKTMTEATSVISDQELQNTNQLRYELRHHLAI